MGEVEFFYTRHICSVCGEAVGLFLSSSYSSLTLADLSGKATTSSISFGASRIEIFEDLNIFCSKCAKSGAEEIQTVCAAGCGRSLQLFFSPSIISVANYFEGIGQRVVARDILGTSVAQAFCSIECLQKKIPKQKVVDWHIEKRERPRSHWLRLEELEEKAYVCSRCKFPFNSGTFMQLPDEREIVRPDFFPNLRKSSICPGCGAQMEDREEPADISVLGYSYARERLEDLLFYLGE
ncbi:MAG: hypothetical protein PHP25_05410 [Candidatus Moranbacteria bacterium]|nr:hypothetical protein [Candidatus Moranbacteria bacterium]